MTAGTDPFDALDEVGWEELSHAYGAADDVPDLLRDLMSDDEDEREEAMDELWGSIYHQGSVYSASAAAVPFLAHVARHAPGGRAMAVSLIASMGREPGDKGPNPETETGRVRAAIIDQLPELLALLREPDVELRRAMLRLLTVVPRELTRPAVDLRELTDPDELVRADLLTALCVAESDWPGLDARLNAALADPAVAVRHSAALALTARSGTPYPPAVVDVLADTVAEAGDLAEDFGGPELWGTADAADPESEGESEDEPEGALNTLLNDPDAALRAARRIVAAGTEHSWLGARLAHDVTDRWRDREADALPILIEHLPQPQDAGRRFVLLGDIARAATRITDPDPQVLQEIRRYLDDRDPKVGPAAVVAAARFHDAACLEYAERIFTAQPQPGPVVAAFCQSLGEQAAFLVPAIRARLVAEVPDPEWWQENLLIALATALQHLGPAAHAAVPELVTLIERDQATIAACAALGTMGPAASAAADTLRVATGHTKQYQRMLAAAAHRAVTGDDTVARSVAAEIAQQGALEDWTTMALGRLGPAGEACVPLLEARLETPPEADKAWLSARAAHALWQITGETARPVAVLAQQIGATRAGFFAIKALTEIGIAPQGCADTLRRLVEAPMRLLHDGRSDPTRHDDDALRDLARRLLSLAEA